MLVSSLPHSLLIATSRSVVPIRCLAQHHNIDVRVPSRNGSLRTLRQFSTGGRSTLLGISKRGDKNIRHLLVQCARSFMLRLDKQSGPVADWTRAMLTRRHSCVVACALASKLARIAWAIVSHNTVFKGQATASVA